MSVWSFSKRQLLQSMLVGIPQIIQARGNVRKLLKSMVLIFCLGACTYQIWSYMNVYWSYPVIVDVFVSYPNRIAAPAFTLCDYNGIRRKRFCSNFPSFCSPQKSYGEFCMTNFAFCRGYTGEEPTQKMPVVTPMELPTNFSKVRSVYRKMGVLTHEFIGEVEYGKKNGREEQISVFNIEGLPTNCFAYNVLWGNTSAELNFVGQTDVYKMLLKTNGEENFYAITPLAIQMAVHSPFLKVNPFTDGFSLRPCTTYKMYLRKTKKVLLPAPYPTNCTDYKIKWKRKGYGPLNQKMCIDECVFNRSISKYSCFDPEKINYPNEDELFCRTDHIEQDFEECTKDCRPGCYEEEMQVKIEEFVYPLTEDNKDSSSCLTMITLHFARTQETSYTYTQKYQIVEAFGYIGGFLGMWLGLSLIAICDFAETCFVILTYAFKKLKCVKRRKNAVAKFVPKTKMLYLQNINRQVVM